MEQKMKTIHSALWSVGSMACFMAVFLACYRLAAPPAPVSFESAGELRGFAAASGLQTRNDGNGDSSIFFISDHPLSTDDIMAVATRGDCGATPGWRGVVWTAQMRPRSVVSYPFQRSGGHWRIWGNMIVAGDERLMDRIEELYRNR
jgi:hypothetical protein